MTIDPSGFEAETVFEEGRGLPYTQLGDWVNHAGISDRAARVYWALCEHLNVKRGDREVWPTQAVLAKVLGIKRAADIAPATDELVVIGAVEIRPEYDNVGRKIRNRYIIHRSPARSYVGPRSLAEFYALLHADSGKQYDLWFASRRKEIADGVARIQQERREADTRAKAEAARRAIGGEESRTTTPPAETRDTAGQSDVRDPSRGRAGSRTTGVRDPAPKQDVVQQDESLSSRLPRQTRKQPPAAPQERETTATPNNDQAQQVAAAWTASRGGRRNPAAEREVAKSAVELLAADWPLADVIALAEDMAAKYPTGRDLGRHADFWQPPKPVQYIPAPVQPVAQPPWCEDLDCDPDSRERTTTNTQGFRYSDPCPACHPDTQKAAA